MLDWPLTALPEMEPADVDLPSRLNDHLLTLWGNDGKKLITMEILL